MAIPATDESQLSHPDGLHCHSATGGRGGGQPPDSGSLPSLPLRLKREILKKNKRKELNLVCRSLPESWHTIIRASNWDAEHSGQDFTRLKKKNRTNL